MDLDLLSANNKTSVLRYKSRYSLSVFILNTFQILIALSYSSLPMHLSFKEIKTHTYQAVHF